MMSWFSKAIAWIICLLAIITNATLSTQLWLLYEFSPIIDEDEENNKIIEFEEMMKKDYQIILNLLEEFRANNFIIICLAILTSLITISLITLTLILRKHLSQLKLLFDESVMCIKQLSGIGVVPNIALLSMILLILLSGFTLLCITTAKYPMLVPTMEKFYIDDIDPMQNLRLFYHIEYVDSKIIRNTLWIYIIGFLWTVEFIIAFEEFCIGAGVAFWYFKPSVYKPSQHAFEVLLKYHLGTIAKSSAVSTLFKVPRLLLISMSKIIRKRVNQLWFQRFQRFEERIGIWNHNAFVPSGMETIDFHSAGKVAWKIAAKNAEQVEKINNIFDIILFLSKFFVATLTCLVGIIILKNKRDYLILKDKDEFFFYMAPVLFGTFCAYCIANIVFSIIQMTVDVLLLCACEDHLIYGGLRCSMIKCNLGKLFKNNEENDIHVIKINKIQKQPFQK
ncbi:choline transporter-like 1 [Episyrphus balteatus]|uniref:choline transporter-like 1 n=1 Tax=Episyrphus balteatus TaxID=286459 RepID=UPI002485885E|nr:choline transporter-like 1 [Episyrphus balteatus]